MFERKELSKTFRGVTISDLHLGHRKTPTEHTIEALETLVLNKEVTGPLDVIFISGDFFDRMLSAASDDYISICIFISKMLRYCKRHNVILRLLEGTSSHDYAQGKIFDIINKTIGAKFRYVDDLEYEYIEDLGVDVIYIPDEYKHDASDTQSDVINLMARNKVDQVDYVIMHGMCHYQAPKHVVNSSMHDYKFYNKITRINTYCGHVHQHSVRDHFIVPGSLDRMVFGDETTKGFMLFEVVDGVPENTFIPNHNAKIYKYLDLKNIDDLSETELSDKIMELATEAVSKYPLGSKFRFLSDVEREIGPYVELVIKKYQGMEWDWDLSRNAKKMQALPKMRDTVDSVNSFTINENNIIDLVKEEIDQFDKDISLECIDLLKGIING